jgi:uncharacterized protein YjbI with pentapeptide repeats
MAMDIPRVSPGARLQMAHAEARRPYLDETPPPADVTWDTCEVAGCFGIRLPGSKLCLAHADRKLRVEYLRGISSGQSPDFRGVRFSDELLRELWAALPVAGDKRVFRSPVFDWATFEGEGAFGAMSVVGKASFAHATFLDHASFSLSDFSAFADFNGTKFLGLQAAFNYTEFKETRFTEAKFATIPSFNETHFTERPYFREAKFLLHEASFNGAKFDAGTLFWDVQLKGLDLSGSIHKWLELRGVQSEGDIRLHGLQLERGLRIGSSSVHGRLLLTQMRCPGRMVIDTFAEDFVVQGVSFERGVRARLAGDNVVVEDCQFDAHSALAGVSSGESAFPRLVSLRGTDAQELTLASLRLDACLFDRALNLESLSIEGSCSFQAPEALWTSERGAIAEEHRMRHEAGEQGWYPEDTRPPDWLETDDSRREFRGIPVEVLGPEKLVITYRSLRTARETGKDEPGAADFYYGEMEMRRKSLRAGGASHPRRRLAWFGEHAVLWLYWLLSGYGLRASRSLAWFAGLLAIASVAFSLWGLEHRAPEPAQVSAPSASQSQAIPTKRSTHPAHVTFDEALLSASEGVVGLPIDSRYTFTSAGRAIRIVVRLLGPFLLALALLAMRGRVRR